MRRSVVGLLVGLTLLSLLAVTGWTCYVAHYYGYHAQLGTPWWQGSRLLARYRVYAPWQALVWSWRWGWQVPGARQATVAAGGLVVLFVMMGLLHGRRGGQGHGGSPPAMTGHGTTQWATTREIRKAGLL